MDTVTGTAGRSSRGSVLGRGATTAAIAIVAYAAMDMCHEVLGHGVATLFVDDVTPVSLTTVALSSKGASRLVALAGPLMNLVLGVLAMAWFRRRTTVGTGTFFMWLFATVNLLNGTGYPMYSGILDFGDMAAVIAGWQPHLLWRTGLAVLGAAGYYLALRVASASLARWLDAGGVRRKVIPRLTWPGYVAGGLLLVAGAAMNPIPNLVLLVGVSGGFGCMFGMVFVPALLEPAAAEAAGEVPWGFSWTWVGGAVLVAALFVFAVGPGIALHA
ncbi:hypothetical protein [Luteibacter sp. OK325]|uniref:hypothetical protein n=1 Tax=Luteibacter sp. OK325 TaxID=2135670 RepID=UPI0011B1CDB2|nr:hypothetical protein [Luteibacter sp. OK325]